ncbi:MAG: segregation and condensation protein A [Deltaproteobacteria bacterium]
MQETYNIKIEQFEGPFDLLLFFIQRDELDIYDIPIAKITDDFLNYITTLKKLNINVASEFILMASTLIRIKAKMLLPRRETDESGNLIDPRTDLVNQIIEYKKIRNIISELEILEEERQKIHFRGNKNTEYRILSELYEKNAELEPVSLYRLFSVFRSLLNKAGDHKKVIHSVGIVRYTIESEKTVITKLLTGRKRADFREIFSFSENRLQAVVVFLALLEMLTEGIIRLISGLGQNNFWIEKR